VIRFGVITLFPELVRALGIGGITARAMERALISVSCWNPRDYTEDRHRRVDDRPYGGGPGMVMSPQPLSAATRAARQAMTREVMCDEELAASGDEKRSAVHTVYLTPQGGRFDQARARELAQRKNLLLVCGRYEGVDERFIASEVDEELSLGDFVLSGGELPAMAVIEAITRLLPGALGHAESAVEDSFSGALLDWPHYTRPEEFEGRRVPEVLLSGDHKAIRDWRAAEALARTGKRRPDLIRDARLTSAQYEQLERAQQHSEQGMSPKQEQEQ
jgi:tRNA (guanine37-N1)-methyltransferase